MNSGMRTRSHPRVDVLGTRISAVNMGEVLTHIREITFESFPGGYVCVTGVHGVMESFSDPELRAIHNDSFLTVPDGRPMVWCGRWAGVRIGQVRGVRLTLEVCRIAASKGWPIYLYGGGPDTPGELARRLTQAFPKLTIGGTYSPPFRELTADESAAIDRDIVASGARIVLVGLSTPKQEKWMAHHHMCMPGRLLIGVGAAFDVHTGQSREVPGIVSRLGLEWLVRLLQEPGRLLPRYGRIIPLFLGRIITKTPYAVDHGPRSRL